MRLAVLLIVLAGALIAGIFVLAQSAGPPVEPVQKVIPNDRFSR